MRPTSLNRQHGHSPCFSFMVLRSHLGTKNVDHRMSRYTFKRTEDGIHIIHLGKTWEKIMAAARLIVAIENPQDILVRWSLRTGRSN